MSEFVDPFTGKLYDAPTQGRHGDSDPNASNRPNKRRWGSTYLISNDPVDFVAQTGMGTAIVAKQNPVLIDTHDLGVPCPVFVEMRFAGNGLGNKPILPFVNYYPFSAITPLNVLVKRGIDPTAGLYEEKFSLNNSGDVLPFDVVDSRNLIITASLSGTPNKLWVQTLATPVHEIGTKSKVIGFQKTNATNFAANAASVLFLPDNPGRVSFMITNTSTNANLFVSFGSSSTITAATFVLPKNMFAVYESPIGGYAGRVAGIWDDPAPNGRAFVTEGVY